MSRVLEGMYGLQPVHKSRRIIRPLGPEVRSLARFRSQFSRADGICKFRRVWIDPIYGTHESFPSHRSDALYQGTTSVGP